MSHLVRLRGKDTVQCAHCAVVLWCREHLVELKKKYFFLAKKSTFFLLKKNSFFLAPPGALCTTAPLETKHYWASSTFSNFHSGIAVLKYTLQITFI